MSDADPPRPTYSEADAALALRRAASLQLEAAERVERASASTSAHEHDRYDHDALVEAAREVGIDAAFVEVALAELSRGGGAVALAPQTDRAATRWLGTRTRSVSASRRFAHPVGKVWPELVRVCEGRDFGLRLDGSEGGHPEDGGVARFHMIDLRDQAKQRGSYTMLCYRMEQLDIDDLRVVLRADGRTVEVTIFGDLRAGVGRNLRWARVSSGVMGTLGGLGVLAIGIGAAPVLVACVAVAGGLAGGGLSLGGWRWMYRSAAGQLRVQLERVLDELARRLEREALMLPAGEG